MLPISGGPSSPRLSNAALSARAAAEPKEAPLRAKRGRVEYDGSSEEDTSDEDFAARHDLCAVEEHNYQQIACGALFSGNCDALANKVYLKAKSLEFNLKF